MSLRILAVIGLAFALALCTGCMGYVTTRTVVAAPPPAPIVEVATVAQNPGYVWVDGYWHWNGYDYEWVAGYWDVPPTVGYVWDPGGWVVVNGGYGYVAGRWVAPGYRTNARYVHPRRRVVVRPAPQPRNRVVVRSSPRPRTVVRSSGRSGTVVRTTPAPRSSVVVRSGPGARTAPRSSVSVRGSAPAARGSARGSTRTRTREGGRASVRVR